MKLNLTTWLNFLPYIIIFVVMLFHPADYDLGWHLKYGEHFIKTGKLITQNPFSTMMPDFNWVSTSWGVDILTYIIFTKWGFEGLAIIGALVTAATFYFYAKAARLRFFHESIIFPLLYILTYPVFVISFRGQIVSILGTGIILYLISTYESGKKKMLLLNIPLILIWSNLHAQFVTGYAILGLWIVLKSITLVRNSNWKEVRNIWLVLGGCTLVTIINPAGIERYQIIYSHLVDPVIQYIIEYSPFALYSSKWWFLVCTGAVLVIAIIIALKKKRLLKTGLWLVSIAIFYPISFFVKRYVWTMYFLICPFLKILVDLIKPKSSTRQMFVGTLILVIFFVIVFITDNPLTRIRSMSWNTYCQKISCPDKALQFLRDKKILADKTNKLLNFYAWGGYMIWQYPDIKPAIDGRMPLWRDERGYSAFAEYIGIEQGLIDINKTNFTHVLISPTRPLYTHLLIQTSEGKWKVIYKDEVALIFARIE